MCDKLTDCGAGTRLVRWRIQFNPVCFGILNLLSLIGASAHRRMQAKAVQVDSQLWGGRPGCARQALQAQVKSAGVPVPARHDFLTRKPCPFEKRGRARDAVDLSAGGRRCLIGQLSLERDHVRAAQRHGFWLQRLVPQVRIARIQDIIETDGRLVVAAG